MMQQVIADRTEPDPATGWILLPGIPESVPACRRIAAEALSGCPRADDLVMAMSELATNALLWSASGEGGWFQVRVRRVTLWARVEVADAGPASAPSAPGNGYGLYVVREMTDRSGTNHQPDGRRIAWAECTWATY